MGRAVESSALGSVEQEKKPLKIERRQMRKGVNMGIQKRKKAGKQMKDVAQNKKDKLDMKCSVNVVRTVLKDLEGIMTAAQKEAITRTPFHQLVSTRLSNNSRNRVLALIECYNLEKKSFDFGEGISLPFNAWEFSIVLGLHHQGQYVHPDLVCGSKIVGRYFKGKMGEVKRSNIIKVLKKLAGTNLTTNFTKVYTLLVFNCVLFPTSHEYTPSFVIHYVDNLNTIGEYAWGQAVYDFFLKSLKRHKQDSKTYVDGCIIGLTGWFYEHVQHLARPRWAPKVPRFARWQEIHRKIEACRENLRMLTNDDLVDFHIMFEEQRFVAPIWPHPETSSIPVPQIMLASAVPVHHESNKTTRKPFLWDEDGDEAEDDDGDGEKDENDEKEEEEDEDEDLSKKTYTMMNKRKSSHVMEKTGRKKQKADKVKKRVKDKNVVKEKKTVKDDRVEDNMVEGDMGGDDIDEDKGYMVGAWVTELRKQRKYGQRAKGKKVSVQPSSITRTIHKRANQGAKKNDADFNTRKSTSKRSKRTRRTVVEMARHESIVDVDAFHEVEGGEKIHVDMEIDSFKEYIGRRDYVNRDGLSLAQREIIEMWLDSEYAGEDVWSAGIYTVKRSSLCNLLFNGAICNDLINAYLKMICSKEFRMAHGIQHKIWYINAYTTTAILEAMKKFKKANLSYREFKACEAMMRSSGIFDFKEIGDIIAVGVRIIVLPIHFDFHWFMLVLDMTGEKNQIIARNSLWDSKYLIPQACIAKFMHWFMFNIHKMEFEDRVVKDMKCRQEGMVSMDSGVHVLWWCEAYMRNCASFWAEEMEVDMAAYRTQIALRFIDSNYDLGTSSTLTCNIVDKFAPQAKPSEPTQPHFNDPSQFPRCDVEDP